MKCILVKRTILKGSQGFQAEKQKENNRIRVQGCCFLYVCDVPFIFCQMTSFTLVLNVIIYDEVHNMDKNVPFSLPISIMLQQLGNLPDKMCFKHTLKLFQAVINTIVQFSISYMTASMHASFMAKHKTSTTHLKYIASLIRHISKLLQNSNLFSTNGPFRNYTDPK